MLNIILFVLALFVLNRAFGGFLKWVPNNTEGDGPVSGGRWEREPIWEVARRAWDKIGRGINGLRYPVSFAEGLYRRILAAVGVVLLVLAIGVGSVNLSPSLSPRDALDRAIREFQAYAGLVVDGVFGPDTVKAYYGKRS